MSTKWCCVLAVVCLSVILSLDADAQPTTDDITSCSASTLEVVANMVKTIASDLQQNMEEIVRRQLADCGCVGAKSTTVNPIYSSTQSTPGTSCLVLIIVKRPTEYHANEIGISINIDKNEYEWNCSPWCTLTAPIDTKDRPYPSEIIVLI